MWRHRIRLFATECRPGGHAFESCHKTYVVHCWLINPNKLNLLSWLLSIYLINQARVQEFVRGGGPKILKPYFFCFFLNFSGGGQLRK